MVNVLWGKWHNNCLMVLTTLSNSRFSPRSPVAFKYCSFPQTNSNQVAFPIPWKELPALHSEMTCNDHKLGVMFLLQLCLLVSWSNLNMHIDFQHLCKETSQDCNITVHSECHSIFVTNFLWKLYCKQFFVLGSSCL